MLEYLVKLYVELNDMCDEGPFDPAMFKMKHDEYAKLYSKALSLEQSSEVTHLIKKHFCE